MLDRIEVDIVRASFKIPIFADRVLPEAPLPKQILTTMIAATVKPAATMLRVNDDLIAFHRPEKSESPGGKVKMACR